MSGRVFSLTAEELQARRAELLDRLAMSWDRATELADQYALETRERNIYETIRAIDFLIGDE